MDEKELRTQLEKEYGENNVWNTEELQKEFTVHSFLAPYVTVTRKSDNALGSLTFTHLPRFYYNFLKH